MWLIRILWFAVALAVWTMLAGTLAIGFCAVLAGYWLVTGIAALWRGGPETRDRLAEKRRLLALAERYNQEADQAARSRVRIRRRGAARARARVSGRERVG